MERSHHRLQTMPSNAPHIHNNNAIVRDLKSSNNDSFPFPIEVMIMILLGCVVLLVMVCIGLMYLWGRRVRKAAEKYCNDAALHDKIDRESILVGDVEDMDMGSNLSSFLDKVDGNDSCISIVR